MAESGIYEIVNLVNGKRYVGSAVNLAQRWRQHRCELGKNRHYSRHLQASWNKRGAANFEFRVLELVADKGNLIDREQHHIDTLKPEYNNRKRAESNLGHKFGAEFGQRITQQNNERWADQEYRRKQSEAHKGYKQSPEVIEKRAAARRGVPLSSEHRQKLVDILGEINRSEKHRAALSKYWKGRAKTPEQIAKMAATKRGRPAHNRGKSMSAEQKAKQAAAMIAKYDEPGFREKISAATKAAMNTPEMRARLRDVNLGRKQSAETIAKRAASMKRAYADGRISRDKSPEHRAKIGEASRAMWAKRKAANS